MATLTGTVNQITIESKELHRILADLSDSDEDRRLIALINLRKSKIRDSDQDIRDNTPLFHGGVVKRVVDMLSASESKAEIQFECAWILTNIANGSSTDVLRFFDVGAPKALFQVLSSTPTSKVCAQVAWAIANFVGDSYASRDYALRQGVLETLLRLCVPDPKNALLRVLTWCILNCCRGLPRPDYKMVRMAYPKMGDMLACSDDQVLIDVCWTLKYLSDHDVNEFNVTKGTFEHDQSLSSTKIDDLIAIGKNHQIIKLLMHPNVALRKAAFNVVGNCVRGNAKQTQSFIDAGCLGPIGSTLSNETDLGLLRTTSWIISNIAGGSDKQLIDLVDSGVYVRVLQLAYHHDNKLLNEIAWIIDNTLSSSDSRVHQYLVNHGLLPALVALMRGPDAEVVEVALRGLSKLLRGLGDYNEYRIGVSQVGGIFTLEKLLSSRHEEVARQILQEHFSVPKKMIPKPPLPTTIRTPIDPAVSAFAVEVVREEIADMAL